MDSELKSNDSEEPTRPKQPRVAMYLAFRDAFSDYALSQPKSRTEAEQEGARLRNKNMDNIEDPEIEERSRELLEVVEGGPTKREQEAMSLRERHPEIGEEEAEALLKRLRNLRETILNKGKVSDDPSYRDKELYPGEVYTLGSSDGSLCVIAEDLPDDMEQTIEQVNGESNAILSLSARHEDGNKFGFDVYSDGTFSLVAILAGIKPGDNDLEYPIERPTPLSEMRSYEKNILIFCLEQMEKQIRT